VGVVGVKKKTKNISNSARTSTTAISARSILSSIKPSINHQSPLEGWGWVQSLNLD
jgi:hypothetical protein